MLEGDIACKQRQLEVWHPMCGHLWAFDMLSSLALWTFAGAGVKSYAKGHLTYLLIRQFKLLLEDLSVCIELDQAVDPAPGQPLLTTHQQASPLCLCAIWPVHQLVCALFGLCIQWHVSHLACAISEMCINWHVHRLA